MLTLRSDCRFVIDFNTQNFEVNWVELALEVTVQLMRDLDNEFVSPNPFKFNLPPSFFKRNSYASSLDIKLGRESESKRALASISWPELLLALTTAIARIILRKATDEGLIISGKSKSFPILSKSIKHLLSNTFFKLASALG